MLDTVQITDTDSTFEPGRKVQIPYSANQVVGFHPTLKKLVSAARKHVLIIPVGAMANLADAQEFKLAVPFPFTLDSVNWRQGDKAVTTGSKLSTATGRVAGASVTGGVVALTSATCTPTGAQVAGSAITAGNTGASGDTVGVLMSATTAFVEGNGYFVFNLTELMA